MFRFLIVLGILPCVSLAEPLPELPKFVRFAHFKAQPGEVTRIEIKSHSGKGSLKVEDRNGLHRGQMRVDWDQMIDRKEFVEAGVRKLSYRVLKDRVVTTVELDGKEKVQEKVSPLVGETVEGMQDSLGQWKFFLDHLSGTEQTRMLEQLETYEAREWFVGGAMRVGDAWPFQPSFIRHMMERDAKGAEIEATMTLSAIDYVGEVPVAKLDFTILSKGATAEADASAFFKGTSYIDLRNMLDYHTEMEGYLHGHVDQEGAEARVKIPLHFIVKQSVQKPL